MAESGEISSRGAINADYESMRTGVIVDDGMATLLPTLYFDPQPKCAIRGYDLAIEQTWDGHPVAHDPIEIHMEWHFERVAGKAHKRVVRVFVKSPLFDDPEPPPHLPGVCPGLWNYEVVELFFANAKEQYLEIEIGPHGHWLCILHDGIRKAFNTGENLQLDVQNTFIGETWRCIFEIPLAYFPPGVQMFNAYAIHGSGVNRIYEAYTPVTDGSYDGPDFHRLKFFKKFNIQQIIPEGFNTTPYNDIRYGNLWEGK